MTDAGFIFALCLGAALLAILFGAAHLAAYRLERRRQVRHSAIRP